jgi:CheY-like chemotaxis protein
MQQQPHQHHIIRKTNGPWVLVVDDDTDLRMMVMFMIQERGFKTLGAPDGVEAVKMLVKALHQDHMPIIAFIDLNMPLLTGWDLLYWYDVAQPKIQNIRFVATTAEMAPDLDPKFTVLKKPYTEEQVMAQIDIALKESKQRK